MKIGKLEMRCGSCRIIDFCDEPFSEIAICTEKRFEDIEENDFVRLAEESKKRYKKEIIDDVYERLEG